MAEGGEQFEAITGSHGGNARGWKFDSRDVGFSEAETTEQVDVPTGGEY